MTRVSAEHVNSAPRGAPCDRGVLATLKSERRIVLGLTIAVLAFYGSAISNQFTLDSIAFLTEDRRVVEFRVGELLTTDWWNVGARSSHSVDTNGGLYRPASLLWLATFRGLTTEASLKKRTSAVLNFANLMLHLVGVLLRFVLLIWILQGLPDAARWAGVGALILGVHPISSEAVCTQVGCAEGLSVVFASASLLAFLRALAAPSRWAWTAHGGFLMLALLSKESAVALPFAVGLLAMLIGGRSLRGAVAATLPSFAVLAGWLLLRRLVLGSVADVGDEVLGLFPTGARIATAFAVIGSYDLSAVLFPMWLHPNPTLMELAPAASSDDPRTLVGLLAVAGVLAGVVIGWRRAPRVAFGLAFFGGILLPVTNLLVLIGALGATRFLYLPLTGVAIAVAAGSARLSASARWRPVGWLLAGWFVVVPPCLTDVGRWSTQLELFEAAAAAYPESCQAWYQIGVEYQSAGELAKARAAFEVAARAPLPVVPGAAGRVYEDALEMRFKASINRAALARGRLPAIMRSGDRGAFEAALKEADVWLGRAAEAAAKGGAMAAAGAALKTEWSGLQTQALLERGSVRLQRLGVLPKEQHAGALMGVRRIVSEMEEVRPGGLKAGLLLLLADQGAGGMTRATADRRFDALYQRALESSMDAARSVVQAYIQYLQRSGRRDLAARVLLDARAAAVVTPDGTATCEAALAAAASSSPSIKALGRSVLEEIVERPAGIAPRLLQQARVALRGR